MFILDHQEVKYCQVIRPILGKFNKLPGLAYYNRLFYQLESHPKTQYKAAVKRARDFFDEAEQRLLFLVIEEENEYSIWREDSQLISVKDFELQLATKKEIPFKQNSKDIVEQSSKPGGFSRIKRLMAKDLSEVFGTC